MNAILLACEVVGAIVVWDLSHRACVRSKAPPTGATAPDEREAAGPVLRLAAKLADGLLIALLQVFIIVIVVLLEACGLISSWLMALGIGLAALVFVAYFAILTANSRQPWGKRLAGVEVERATGGQLGWTGSLVRAAADFLMTSLWPVLLGLINPLWMLTNRRRRALHDVLAGSRVLRARAPSRLLPCAATLGWLAPFLLVFGLVRPVIVQAYWIPSRGMSPTLTNGDRIIANKLTYRVTAVRRGDIVVFSPPPSAIPGGGRARDFVRRVVAVPGDRVQIKAGDGIYVNEAKQDFPSMSVPTYDWPVDALNLSVAQPYLVPDGAYFVLGDNCNQSNDSHVWRDPDTGQPAPGLPRALIRGKVMLRYWPPSRLGKVG